MRYIIIVTFFLLTSCITTSQFDQHAYIQTTSLKVDAINLMNLAENDFTSNRKQIQTVIIQMDKVYEYEKNRPNNSLTIQLWDKLRDSTGHLFGGFISRWERDGTLRPTFIKESKLQVSEAFDIIAQLESKKIKPKQANR